MIHINRLRVLIRTENSDYGFDESFSQGLNIIASDDNTYGKSSIIIAIYYALGVESIVGGTNEKVMTSVYLNKIEEDDESSYNVIESSVFLEIEGPYGIVTLYRTAKNANRDSKLVTVYFSKLEDIYDKDTSSEDYYVNMQNSATSKKGFHNFLEHFMCMELPVVPATDGVERKLYLQLLMAAFFIEQKNGWSGIYSGMPYLGIKDSKKRVTEFILGLKVSENDIKRIENANKERNLIEKWKVIYNDFEKLQRANQCEISSIQSVPELPNTDKENSIEIFCTTKPDVTIDNWIEQLRQEIENLSSIKPKVVDNYVELENELKATEARIEEFTNAEKELLNSINNLKMKIVDLDECLNTITEDIANNKDAQKLQKLGSKLNYVSFEGSCPTCHQKIIDSLLDYQQESHIMSIDETLTHLAAQKELIMFAIGNHRENLSFLQNKYDLLLSERASMLRIAKALRNDLYSIDDNYSETIIYKKIELEQKVEALEDFKKDVKTYLDKFSKMRNEWQQIQIEKAKLPKNGISEEDNKRLEQFTEYFATNLKLYNYYSTNSIESIEISKDRFMPVIDNFDMKFGSSASDNIRAIWAYTVALVQTADANKCDKPGIMIFDEPTQHSIGADDLKSFLNSIITLSNNNQTIVGITMNSSDVRKVIQELNNEDYKMIHLKGRAFKRL